ncbi:MerR family transcriptional regulator [Dethiosulfatarculus sandiegensis]|uniref:HTH merR-type domain-containing protein n=1 Tax=Dethiosulfatarculus sandiegensis TaxID=1429043 RepID=A0A0D2GHD2_9BACT|nr:MerR family transcriptional regulator [Dethiosulfatarculus sandiegensis]KIX14322.1 hypothetical protein X474_08600 [Dethiosulfatarculus sandiegensis]
METPLLQIGEVAKRCNTTIRTVRYYLQEGLISEADRSQGGFYLFEEAAVEKVRYICMLREIGLSLQEIKMLIHIRRSSDTGGEAAQHLRERLGEQLKMSEEKIEEFKKLKTEITGTIKVLEGCEGCQNKPRHSTCSKCRVLKDSEKLPAPMKAVY